MFSNFSIDVSLILVGTAIVSIGILAFVIFFNNYKSATSKAFLFFSLTTIFWSFLNYLSYQFNSEILVLWILRFVMFFAVWHAFSIFTLFYVFPDEKMQFPSKYKYVMLPFVAISSLVTLTPFVFKGIAEMLPNGGAGKVINGPGMAIFGPLVLVLIIGGFILLIRKTLNKKGVEQDRFIFLLIGASIFFIFLLIFNFILPAFWNNSSLIPLSAIFIFPFIGFTAYSIVRYGLFNIKLIATELLTFSIWVIIFVEFLLADALKERMIDSGVFVFVVVSGILLIRSVKREVYQREELEKLTHELQHANEELKQLDKAKSEFISIVSHQLRTPLSVTKGYVSMILEGIYGAVDEKIKETLSKVYVANEGLIALVNNLLDLSRMEAGTIKYEFTNESFEKMIDEIVMELELEAKHRDLWLRWNRPKEAMPLIKADSIKLKQVVEILIENSLKYTPKGGVDVRLAKDGDALLFEVRDTGIGIDPKEIGHLFNKFGRGQEGSKINATGVGLGLYAAKQIVLAHGGQIWVESEGLGKGSTFSVKLPIAK